MDKAYLSFKVNTLQKSQQGFKLPNGLKSDKSRAARDDVFLSVAQKF